ncbi:MAG TPA: hypothetical protein VHV77_15680 [Pirellulales bacterium]|nr:hypothetical protein [Pirellulales bacterium]
MTRVSIRSKTHRFRSFVLAVTAFLVANAGCNRAWYCDGTGCARTPPPPRQRLLPWRRGVEKTFQDKVESDPFPTAQEQGIEGAPGKPAG